MAQNYRRSKVEKLVKYILTKVEVNDRLREEASAESKDKYQYSNVELKQVLDYIQEEFDIDSKQFIK